MEGANAALADSPNRASSLPLRIASVAVLIPVVVGAAWWYWSTATIVAVCIVVGVVELYGIFSRGGYAPRVALGVGIALLLWAAQTLQPYTSISLDRLAVALSVIAGLIYELTRRDRSTSLASWAFTLVGAYYVSGLLSGFVLLRQLDLPLRNGWLAGLGMEPGTAWVMLGLAITWLNDTAAYFAGRSFGRHRMSPVLSPKKTWEGFAGGMLASLATALLAVPLLGLPIGYGAATLIGLAAGMAGVLGDLAESLIKRQIGIKDSGTLIPGHGGLLDRMDSLLFTGPVIYYVVLLTLAF